MKKYIVLKSEDTVIEGKTYYQLVGQYDALSQAFSKNIKEGVSETAVLKVVDVEIKEKQ
jgi:hypothetical protein